MQDWQTLGRTKSASFDLQIFSGVAISFLAPEPTSVDLRMSADQEAAKEACLTKRIAGPNSELHQVEYLSTGPSLVPQCQCCR